jgi:hypothetical protein
MWAFAWFRIRAAWNRKYTSLPLKRLSILVVLKLVLQVLSLAALVSACSPAPMPSTSPADLATIVAGTASALQTAAPITLPSRPLSSPAAAPSAPTPTSAPPVRIHFPPDGTTVLLKAHIAAEAAQTYAFQAIQGQPMLVAITPGESLALSIETQGGTSLLRPSLGQSTWSGVIPRTEDYYLTVTGGHKAADYALQVELVTRIKFNEGATSTLVNGATADGLPMVYSVFAAAGKQLDISFAAGSSSAYLAVHGFADGKEYLPASAAKARLLLDVSQTQDYIIEVIPKDQKALHFALSVEIK